MATYFQARKAVKVFTEYKRLTLAHWAARPKNTRTWMNADSAMPQNAQSRAVREQLMMLLPEAQTSARLLGVAVTATSYPAPMIGGPVLTVDLLYAAVDQYQGHSTISCDVIMDNIVKCLASAQATEKKQFYHQLVNPVWWLTEIIAYVLRIPFLILRRAGVPAKVEESVWGNIFKVAFLLLMIWLSLRYGFNLTAKDILNWIK
jgi:hypothetical protein